MHLDRLATVTSMLGDCPFARNLDIPKIASKLFVLSLKKEPDALTFVIPCLHLLASLDESAIRQSAVDEILALVEKEWVMKTLLKCFSMSPRETVVLSGIYTLIDTNCWYDLLLAHADILLKVIQYLTRTDSIDNLLATILKARRTDKARELLLQYFKYHLPDSSISAESTLDELMGMYEKHKN